eukprot:8521705-Pyramimonas_sp.AAC.1
MVFFHASSHPRSLTSPPSSPSHTAQHNTALLSIAQHSSAQLSSAQLSPAQHNSAQQGIAGVAFSRHHR